jgi:hypothetical protein
MLIHNKLRFFQQFFDAFVNLGPMDEIVFEFDTT